MNGGLQASDSPLPERSWVLYDGECGFCTRWVHIFGSGPTRAYSEAPSFRLRYL
jgi:hypothetical protein